MQHFCEQVILTLNAISILPAKLFNMNVITCQTLPAPYYFINPIETSHGRMRGEGLFVSPPILQGHHDEAVEELFMIGQLKNYERCEMGENVPKDTFFEVELMPSSAWRREQLVFSSNSQEDILAATPLRMKVSSKDTFL